MQRMSSSGGHQFMRILFLISALAVFLISCRKDGTANCSGLKEAVSSNNIEEVNSIITSYILELLS